MCWPLVVVEVGLAVLRLRLEVHRTTEAGLAELRDQELRAGFRHHFLAQPKQLWSARAEAEARGLLLLALLALAVVPQTLQVSEL